MNELVRYDNKLVEAVYCFDLLEKKLMIAISLMYQNNPESDSMVFSLDHLEKIMGISKDSYRHIKKALKSIASKTITIETPSKKFPEKPNYLIFTIITKAKYDNGILIVKINDEIKPYLIDLAERYTTYHIENIKPLASSYSIRMYELLKMHEKQKNKQCEYTIEELRSMMGITTEYGRYNDLKRYVLEQAKRDLKEKTDIKFTYKEEKLGRSVHKIIFTIRENSEEKENRKKVSEARKREKQIEQSQLTLDQVVQFTLEENRDFAEKLAKKARGEKTEEPDILKKTTKTNLTEEQAEDRRKYNDVIIPTGKRQIDKEWRQKRGVQ